jgi:hypothetical protein
VRSLWKQGPVCFCTLTSCFNIYERSISVLPFIKAYNCFNTHTHTVWIRVTLRLAVYRQSVRLGVQPLETHGQNFFSQLNTCGHSLYITSSLTRGWVCHLQLLLSLASAFILGSDSRGTRDHILSSQIRDFPFCRLLRLAGLRWKYSTPPAHGNTYIHRHKPIYIYRDAGKSNKENYIHEAVNKQIYFRERSLLLFPNLSTFYIFS